MSQNLDTDLAPSLLAAAASEVSLSSADPAQRIRVHLADFQRGLAAGTLPIRLPRPPREWVSRGEGHFHLAAELFLQVTGWTRFEFPHESLLVEPGEAALLPPRLLHAERVGTDASGAPFCNVVIYADGDRLSCHLAHERAPGLPGILHLESRHHPQALRIHDWLIDAARLGEAPDSRVERESASQDWAIAQVRALASAATAGVLRALDDAASSSPPEPPLVARVRVLVQNQLGDHQLSVRGLAEQSRCTPDYLSYVFSSATGEHLVAFINRQRMERAARLLRESSLAGKEVAWACGFSTQSYFIRTFRAHFGVTPKAWRAANE